MFCNIHIFITYIPVWIIYSNIAFATFFILNCYTKLLHWEVITFYARKKDLVFSARGSVLGDVGRNITSIYKLAYLKQFIQNSEDMNVNKYKNHFIKSFSQLFLFMSFNIMKIWWEKNNYNTSILVL